jgi:ATP-dependent DNA ligase
MKIGKPIEPMLVAESGADEGKFAKIVKKHGGKTFAEIKYDGYRMQVHKSGLDKIRMFTSGLNELNPELFPDLRKQFAELPLGIFDSELVGFGTNREQFEAVQNRMNSKTDKSLVKRYPLQLRFFDVMQIENKPVMEVPLYERRKILENHASNISDQFVFDSGDSLRGKFEEVVDENLEGLVCKNPGSIYVPGSRSQDWIKLKNFSTFDLVVLGLYHGEGKTADWPFAAVLLGTKNNQNYETLVKLGIMNKKIVDEIYGLVKPGLSEKVPANLVLSPELSKKTYARKIPYTFVMPEKSSIIEVKALNISRSENWSSCGLENGEAYSLRIASFNRIRYDKTPGKATTTQQIKELYIK